MIEFGEFSQFLFSWWVLVSCVWGGICILGGESLGTAVFVSLIYLALVLVMLIPSMILGVE